MRARVVLRTFQGEDRSYDPGEIVDVDTWRLSSAKSLETRRYLGTVEYGAEPVTCKCGRQWIGKQARAQHGCDARYLNPGRAGRPEEAPHV